MRSRRIGLILLCGLLCVVEAGAAVGGAEAKCAEASFLVFSAYDRASNRSLTDLRTDYTLYLVTLMDDQLVTPYEWINVSAMEPERRLAAFQRTVLADLISRFPGNETISVEFRIADTAGLITVRVDSSYAMLYMDSSPGTVASGIEEGVVRPYAGNESVVEFKKAQSAVLERWRQACRDAARMDTGESMNVTFLYRANVSTFECSVTTEAPMEHAISLRCVGRDGSAITDVGPSGGSYEQTAVWVDPECGIADAKCIVDSQDGWRVEVEVEIVGDVVVAAGAAVRAAGVGTNVVVALFFAVLIAGLVWCGYRGRGTFARRGREWSVSYLRRTPAEPVVIVIE
ncbi:pr70.3 [rat cytomegalovirus strain Maastricht]|uniref:Pr70.3 n=1 Tax=Rat cytomegalovirus (strain Maastricht) TaxID=79700 RepID=Q9DWD1_RCMVM|nr:pr70.3 [rat cytomegalovirus strain Maastricht]AAF99159.1 pr70.3 [rat cytomegalovirus strain Maastricht]WEG71989.1 membrane protein m71.2 [Murid betaherpesvirus 2]